MEKTRAQKRAQLRQRIRNQIRKNGEDILKSVNHRNTRNHIQHGNMSVREHTIRVAEYGMRFGRALGIPYNKRDLIRGALLHDYFQYDWHDKNHVKIQNLHGFFHPGIALKNAEKEYKLTKRQKDIIKKHMWPLTVTPPMCREAWLVTAADKYCSLMETVRLHKGSGVGHGRKYYEVQGRGHKCG